MRLRPLPAAAAPLLLLLVLCIAIGAGDLGTAAARPLGQTPPPVVAALEPETADAARLRWTVPGGATSRICAAPDFALTGGSCFNLGVAEDWQVPIPPADGSMLYVSLQACVEDDCTPRVRAGAVGRVQRNGVDFYATATPQADGSVRLAAFARQGPVLIRYYRARAGTAERLDLVCPFVDRGEVCGGATVAPGGALTGVGAADLATPASEQGLTFQVKETPTVAFMFDDGTGIVSGGKYLMQTILDEYGVKGSFFLTGRAMQTYPGAVQALAAAGHRVGSHTWSHPFLTRLSDAAIGDELDRVEQQYRALVPGGTLKPCFRAPNGDYNARVLSVVQGRGYRQLTQTVSSLDFQGISAAQIVRNVMADVRDGATVSFHTQEPQTATALRTLIPMLLAEGYRFVIPC